jgi:hypothetical protein
VCPGGRTVRRRPGHQRTWKGRWSHFHAVRVSAIPQRSSGRTAGVAVRVSGVERGRNPSVRADGITASGLRADTEIPESAKKSPATGGN